MDLDAIIADAARVARAREAAHTHVVPDLKPLVAEASHIVKTRERLKRRRIRTQLAQADLERQSQLFAFQTADEDAMLGCSLREEAVRGLPMSATSHQCRVEFDEKGGKRLKHTHGVAGTCVYTALCFRCGKVLPGQNRRWCSNTCANIWWSNHLWTEASTVRRRMDKHTCVKCGKKGGDIIAEGDCALCHEQWPCEQYLRAGTTNSFHRPIPVTVRLEVNHKDPRVGRGYDKGCAHHLDGLETLCHGCHVIVTAEQRRARSKEARTERLFDLDHPPKGIPL